jgi:hypothetical protein
MGVMFFLAAVVAGGSAPADAMRVPVPVRYRYVYEESKQICPHMYDLMMAKSSKASTDYSVEAGQARGMSENEVWLLNMYCVSYISGRTEGQFSR